ncbi:Tripartite ATP-independent periplasmic transporters, DctQ component [Roseivivax jejudonensis]|uniref:TRAP transporter small permease protein n=1 Tax=Roseivivax jejudonensis TaxID=1529041 RepID=A0A1X7A5I0_9RHOB|nr:TRAP transporter small permease [Roseivivax jejudonensis]SLN71068.1 Tripartite ATP-independent periplasmic transporters, DctQ component [Roseivivax jejudonensis]
MMGRIARLAATGLDLAGALLALVAIFLVTWEAGTRYVAARYSNDWGTEVVIYLLVWSAALVTARTAFETRHVSANVLIDLAPLRIRQAAFLVALVAGIAFGALLAVYGAEVVRFAIRFGTTGDSSLRLPMAWYYSVLPTMGALLSIGYGVRLARFVADPAARLPGQTPIEGEVA